MKDATRTSKSRRRPSSRRPTQDRKCILCRPLCTSTRLSISRGRVVAAASGVLGVVVAAHGEWWEEKGGWVEVVEGPELMLMRRGSHSHSRYYYCCRCRCR